MPYVITAVSFIISKSSCNYQYYLDKYQQVNTLGKTVDWEKGYWEVELEGEFLNVKLWSNRNIKKPIQHSINKENLVVYCGYMNFYFCNVEDEACYRLPKDRRIISRANKNHEIFMYNVG